MKRLAALLLLVIVALPAGGAAARDTPSPVCAPRAAPAPAGEATLVSETAAGGRLRTLTLDSPALGARTRVNVLLPREYDPSGATRYPVLYLLHGALADYNDWNYSGGITSLVDEVDGLPPFIVVMPDGGHYGWYSDWYGTDLGSSGAAPAWARYHVGELIPWIDAHLPTVGDRTGRAIAGLSMGGFGAMSYASRHPDLFAAAGSFSGALNPTYGPGYGQAFVTLASAYFNDAHVTQCIWGDAATQQVRWMGHDPTYLAGNLAATRLFVASGAAPPAPGDLTSPVGVISTPVEETCFLMSRAFARALDAAGVPHRDDFYGSGTHEMKYWQQELRRFLPEMAAAWADPEPAPATFSYRSVADRFSVWGWRFRAHRRVTEFVYLREVGADGMEITGSGRLDVVSPPQYAAGARYRVTRDGIPRLVLADAKGRLRFPVALGPSHREQQRSFGEAAVGSWPRAVVQISPA